MAGGSAAQLRRGFSALKPGVSWPPRLRLRGLPFSATEADVRAFLQGFELARTADDKGDVEIIRRSVDGLPTGHAFAYFKDWEEACRARREKQRAYLGNRWIEMYVDWSPDWHREGPI
ncbi:ESRP2 [Symbiodinium natans]|uniref:ESRP2 protein n=1 Tax=Symbiodinium natans TaxID=878477 RepID=A0A812LBE0_9DINO|nr:ESRP2 [Symbiodinium natans]